MRYPLILEFLGLMFNLYKCVTLQTDSDGQLCCEEHSSSPKVGPLSKRSCSTGRLFSDQNYGVRFYHNMNEFEITSYASFIFNKNLEKHWIISTINFIFLFKN